MEPVEEIKVCSRCNKGKKISEYQYYFVGGEKKRVNNCKSCKKKIIRGDPSKEEDHQCNRCWEFKPGLDFDVYKYKEERRRRKHCKKCNLRRGEKIPDDVKVKLWVASTTSK